LFFFEQTVLLYMLIASGIGGELKIMPQKSVFEYAPDSTWINIIPFSRIYALQGFLMIAFVYLKEHDENRKTKVKRSRSIYIKCTVIIAINTITYGFCDSISLFFKPEMSVIWNIIFISLCVLLMLV
jgi:hypothetical protein